MQLEDRDRARTLLPLVNSRTELGEWARDEIARVERWLAAPAPIEQPDAPPLGPESEGPSSDGRG